MFCPECGEVVGAGPLDARRAARQRTGSALGRWIDAALGVLALPRARRNAGGPGRRTHQG